MPSQCIFDLDNADRPFTVGSEYYVSGRVILKTEFVKHISSLSIRFYGRVKVSFPVRSFEHATSQEDLFEVYDTQEMRRELQPGLHNYPFNFRLPSNCLTSLESEFGHIRYELSLIIVNQNKYSNIFKKAITVIRPYNLNARPIPQTQPTVYSSSRLCVDALVGITLLVSLQTHAPGQLIPFVLQVTHTNYAGIDSCGIQFVKKMTFTGKVRNSPEPQETTTTSILFETSLPGAKSLRHNYVGTIPIPSTPPTSQYKKISVEYFVIAHAKVKNTVEVRGQASIIIGTVPLRMTLPGNEQSPITPCSYAKANSGEVPFIDLNGGVNRIDDFLPVYPQYNTSLVIENILQLL